MTATTPTGASVLSDTGAGASPPATKPPRRRGVWRWVLGVLAILIAAVAIFLALFNWDLFRPTLAKMLSARLHRPVRIEGHLKVHLFSFTPSASLGGLQIGEPAWAPKTDLADVGDIKVQVKLLPLLVGHVVMPLLEVDQPKVFMFQDKAGKANWDFSNGAAPGKPAKLPAIQNFVINDGDLSVTSLQRKLAFTGKLYAHEKDTGGSATGFRMAGQGTLNAKPFVMNITGGPLLNVRPNVPYPFDGDVRAGDTRVTAKGRVLHPFNLGQIDAAVSLSGNDLADLYYLTGLTLPNTPRYSIAGQLKRDEKVYTFDKFAGRVGGSDLEGDLKADLSKNNRPDLTAKLQSRVLDFKDLGSLFGATGKNTPAAPKVALAPKSPAPVRRLLPDSTLDVSRIRGMDADVHYKALTVRAAPNLPLRQVSLGVKLDHGLLTLDPIDLSFPQGRLSGNASINARNAVQRNAVDIRLTGVQLQNFIPSKGGPPPLEGKLDARAKVSGTGDSVHKAAASSNGEVTLVIPGGVIRQVFAELLGIDATKGLFMLLSKDQHQTDIRCAVADFQVRNGVLQARQLVVDTGVVQVVGQGNIDLNAETVDLSFSGKPKQFRLIRIDAPITVGGHLAAPTFGIKPGGVIAQAGIGVVLAAAINPALAILPFINTSYAHDANCAGVVQVAQSHGAPVKLPGKTIAKPRR